MSDSIGTTLEHDHHRIDAHFAAFAASLQTGAPALDELAAGAEGLRHHIWVEEEVHFPPLRAAGLMGPLMVMEREHGQLWDALDAIQAGLATGEDVAERWASFIALLEAHNAKEEQIVYPAGDQVLDEGAVDDVRDALATAMPAGWVCAMAGRVG